MRGYDDQKYRKNLASAFQKIAKRIEQDEEFVRWLFEEQSVQKTETGSRTESEIPDVFLLFSRVGVEGLAKKLKVMELEGLRDLLKKYGLDPSYKIRRWKNKEKVVAFILETVERRSAKGSAFLQEKP